MYFTLIYSRGCRAPRGALKLGTLALVSSYLGLFNFFTHIPTLLLLFLCLLLPLASPLLFPFARYPVRDTHPVHGIPGPCMHILSGAQDVFSTQRLRSD